MSPEKRAELSEKLKAKWASGTRRPNPPETYLKSSESIRRRVRELGRWDGLTPEACSKGGKTVTERQLAKAREIGAAKRGKPNPPGPSAKGVDNWAAKFWMLWSPDRVLISGVNLNEIVRRHAHLFTAGDLAARGSNTVASKGLANLFRVQVRKGKRVVLGHWHGWRAVDRAEMVKDVRPPDGMRVMWKPVIERAD